MAYPLRDSDKFLTVYRHTMSLNLLNLVAFARRYGGTTNNPAGFALPPTGVAFAYRLYNYDKITKCL